MPRRPSANPFAALVYDLRSIGPEGLPWEEIRDLANAAGPHIRFRGSDRLDNRSKALVLTVAIAAVLVPELGPAWVLSAAQACDEAVRSRRGFFFDRLARELEYRGLAADGRDALNRLQSAASRAVDWFLARQRAEGAP